MTTLMDLTDIARAAVEQVPPGRRFRQSDSDVITGQRDLLLGLEQDLVASFYDTLFAHPPTAAVFTEGERPTREDQLAHWWRRTVTGPHDERYFAWMAMVGLVHVVRGVSNPMMLAMKDHVVDFVVDRTQEAGLHPEEADELAAAFGRLFSTIAVIIAFGYDRAVTDALYSVAGMPEALLTRLRTQEALASLARARQAGVS
ncbi:MAG: protoglobin domain-containing protein [Actinomycetales bacterium]